MTLCCPRAWLCIYPVPYITVAWHSYSQNPYPDLLNAEVCKIQYPIQLLLWSLICCQYVWRHDMKTLSGLLAFLRRTHRSLDSPRNGPEILSSDVSSDVSMETPLNKESSCEIATDLMSYGRVNTTDVVLEYHSICSKLLSRPHEIAWCWKNMDWSSVCIIAIDPPSPP